MSLTSLTSWLPSVFRSRDTTECGSKGAYAADNDRDSHRQAEKITHVPSTQPKWASMPDERGCGIDTMTSTSRVLQRSKERRAKFMSGMSNTEPIEVSELESLPGLRTCSHI
jgi:hypothetical protein